MPYKDRTNKINVAMDRDLHDFIYNLQKPHETLNDTLRRLLKK